MGEGIMRNGTMRNGTMRAIRVHAHGGPDVLQLEHVPVPQATDAQVLVRVEAAGINFIDVYKRTGLYTIPLPATLGEEGAGTVLAGGDAHGFHEGDRVAWTGVLGSYADVVAVPAAKLVRIPDGVSTAHAAATMLQGMTAHYLATSTFPLAS
jgi:NADPH2:quinone reductase